MLKKPGTPDISYAALNEHVANSVDWSSGFPFF